MTNALKFTESAIRALEPREKVYRVGDKNTPNLYVRVQPTGTKTYSYETKMNNETIKITIGHAGTQGLTLSKAKELVQQYNGTKAAGLNPATELKNKQASDKAKRAQEKQQSEIDNTTLADLWALYVQYKSKIIISKTQRKWSALTLKDHFTMSGLGGIDTERNLDIKPNPNAVMFKLLQTPCGQLTRQTITQWREREELTRPTSTANALRYLKAFIRWVSSNHKRYGIDSIELFDTIHIPAAATKDKDTLDSSEASEWLKQALKTEGVGAVFLTCLLLTGARSNQELARLKWKDIDTKNKIIRLHDKIKKTRDIPLHPYVEALIYSQPKTSQYVFSNATGNGHITPQNHCMRRICERAGICTNLKPLGVSVHGLRRTFTNLARHAGVSEIFANVIKGHTFKDTSGKNYTFITTEELRQPYFQIVNHILELAGIEQSDTTQIGHLKAV